jgi:hypothetical protein
MKKKILVNPALKPIFKIMDDHCKFLKGEKKKAEQLENIQIEVNDYISNLRKECDEFVTKKRQEYQNIEKDLKLTHANYFSKFSKSER